MGAVLATVDCLGDGAGRGIAAAELTDSTRFATLRGLDAGSSAGSGAVLIAASKATYKTRGVFGPGFAEAASVEDEASRPAFFSESDGRSAATALGAASENTQAIKSAEMNDRVLERRISLNILPLCKLVLRILALIVAQCPFWNREKNRFASPDIRVRTAA